MKPKEINHETWLELSPAAQYLGVHFTTLRRWADAGKIPFIRTPGGRRRFAVKALAQFMESMAPRPTTTMAVTLPEATRPRDCVRPLEERAVDLARQSVRNLPMTENWMARLSDAQRLLLRGTGNRLMALLLQYNGRADSGEAFVDEGKRITTEYSQICGQVGLSLQDTVRVFLFFRGTILNTIHETGFLTGCADFEGQRLYLRSTEFLDILLLSLIDSYLQVPSQIST